MILKIIRNFETPSHLRSGKGNYKGHLRILLDNPNIIYIIKIIINKRYI